LNGLTLYFRRDSSGWDGGGDDEVQVGGEQYGSILGGEHGKKLKEAEGDFQLGVLFQQMTTFVQNFHSSSGTF